MVGWRAYTLGAFVGIVAWQVIVTGGPWLLSKRDKLPSNGSYEDVLMAALCGVPLSFVIGLIVAGLD